MLAYTLSGGTLSDIADQHWLKLYQAALLEFDKTKLAERISVAEKAILERLRELEPPADRHPDWQTMQDALVTLGDLRRLNERST